MGRGREGLDPKDKEDKVPIGLQGGLGVSPLAHLSLGSVSRISGDSGVWARPHVASVFLFSLSAGCEYRHVPYKILISPAMEPYLYL